MNINESWKNKNIIYTPTISSGVSCTIKDQFKHIYGYSTNMSALATDFIQMLRRIRHPTEHSFFVYNDSVPYYTSLLSIEEIEKYIQYTHIIGNCHDIVSDIPKYINDNKCVIEKNLAYKIHIYNILEEEINKRYFKEVLIYLAKGKGMKIVEDNSCKKSNKEFKTEVNKIKEKNEEKEIEHIFKSDILNNEEYEYINNLITKEEKITSDQRYSHKLKTMLMKFKYDNEKYEKLSDEHKKQLVMFMNNDDNYNKFVNNCVINVDEAEIDKRIENVRQKDINRRKEKEAHEYKLYYRQHFLINKMLQLVGFKSIKDKNKYTVDSINNKIKANNKELIAIVNEIMYIDKNPSKTAINIKTIGSIIRKFYGITFKGTSTCKKKIKYHAYTLENMIDWNTAFYPNLLKGKKFDEYAFD